MSDTETRDPAAEPTPAQWVDEFLALARADQETRALGVIQHARVATRCFIEAHPASLRSLRRSLDRVIDQRDELRRTLAAARAEVARLREALIEIRSFHGNSIDPDECMTCRAADAALAPVKPSEDEYEAAVTELTKPPVVPSGEAPVVPVGADLDCLTAGCRWGDPSSERCECPPVPSGEAESGEPHPQFSAFLKRALADPETRAAYDEAMARNAAPVPSGGQADGEGESLVEAVAAKVHEAWMATKREQGVSSRPSEWGEEQMVPYAALSERAKDLDRATVTAVLDALDAAGFAARPVLSREAIARAATRAHFDVVRNDATRAEIRDAGLATADAVLALLTAGGEQA